MRKLFMTYAEVRRMHGKEAYHRPSRFLHEIPVELINEIRFRTKVSKPSVHAKHLLSARSAREFRVGRKCNTEFLATGTVLDCEGDGEDMKVKVKFAKVGTKLLIASFLTAK